MHTLIGIGKDTDAPNNPFSDSKNFGALGREIYLSILEIWNERSKLNFRVLGGRFNHIHYS